MELAGAVAAAVTGAHHAIHGLGLLPPSWVWERFAPVVAELARDAGGRRPFDAPRATYLRISPLSLQPQATVAWDDVRLIRPGFGAPSDAERLPIGLDDFLRRPGAPIVHLTLGTVFHETPGVLAAAIEGLRGLRIRLVVTTGPGVVPATFGPQPPNVRIVEYVPDGLFLERCDVVVSHAGAGIMFGALANGLPQLLLPQGADQFANADVCRDAGVALVLAPDEVTAGAAALAVRRLLVSPSFWVNVPRIRRELAAMPAPADVLADLVADAAAAV